MYTLNKSLLSPELPTHIKQWDFVDDHKGQFTKFYCRLAMAKTNKQANSKMILVIPGDCSSWDPSRGKQGLVEPRPPAKSGLQSSPAIKNAVKLVHAHSPLMLTVLSSRQWIKPHFCPRPSQWVKSTFTLPVSQNPAFALPMSHTPLLPCQQVKPHFCPAKELSPTFAINESSCAFALPMSQIPTTTASVVNQWTEDQNWPETGCPACRWHTYNPVRDTCGPGLCQCCLLSLPLQCHLVATGLLAWMKDQIHYLPMGAGGDQITAKLYMWKHYIKNKTTTENVHCTGLARLYQSLPFSSASLMRKSAALSLTEPPPLQNSALARISQPESVIKGLQLVQLFQTSAGMGLVLLKDMEFPGNMITAVNHIFQMHTCFFAHLTEPDQRCSKRSNRKTLVHK